MGCGIDSWTDGWINWLTDRQANRMANIQTEKSMQAVGRMDGRAEDRGIERKAPMEAQSRPSAFGNKDLCRG